MVLHWFSVTGLFEDLGRHISRCAARCRQDVEGFFVHDSRQAKVGYQQVGVVFGGSEEEVLGL